MNGSTRRRTALTAVALATVAVAVLAGIHLAGRDGFGNPATPPARQTYGTAPQYTLIDQAGRTFASTELRGTVQVVSYLFPYCTTYCPLTARTLAQAEGLLGAAGLQGRVAFVAFNVDPQGAGPARLAAFLRQEQIDPADPAWHYLTGRPDQIRRVVTGGFHVFFQKVSLAEEDQEAAEQVRAGEYIPQPTATNPLADQAHVDYDIVHNDIIEVVDRHGAIRTIFGSGSNPGPEQILSAVLRAHRS